MCLKCDISQALNGKDETLILQDVVEKKLIALLKQQASQNGQDPGQYGDDFHAKLYDDAAEQVARETRAAIERYHAADKSNPLLEMMERRSNGVTKAHVNILASYMALKVVQDEHDAKKVARVHT